MILADIRADIVDVADITNTDAQYWRYCYQKLLTDADTDSEILNHDK